MPYTSIQTASGPVRVRYTLSTPSQSSAKVESLDRSIPTLLLLHPTFISHEIFHPQFNDARLRKFNLIAIDTRCHGETSGSVPEGYSPLTAADDVAKFMDALGIPSCHLVGLSAGSSIALQVASAHPSKVLSLFLVSPLPSAMTPEVSEGMKEIYDCWEAGFQDMDNIDETALHDAVYGVLQFGFNNPASSLVRALGEMAFSSGLKNWTPEHFSEFHRACISFTKDAITDAQLERISCPMKLVHCAEDIAFPVELAQQTQMRYQNIGLDAGLLTVAHAGHYGTVTHPESINPLISQFVLANHGSKLSLPCPSLITSPFEAALRQAGWVEDSEEDW
ncbi:hypothetical protein HGRIS_010435 [Hohenbuehelia grisea]|uniref:AB hydrolase-1 domain-containing protein n=1 Tax=Hohenbuehelia grisea TaxID=104357 RepID=A0ABR3IZH0_9AGAR